MGRNYYDRHGRRIPEAIPAAERRLEMSMGHGGLPRDTALPYITEREETLGKLVAFEAVKGNEAACHAHVEQYFKDLAKAKPKTQAQKLSTTLADIFNAADRNGMDSKIVNGLDRLGITTVRQVHLMSDQQIFNLRISAFGQATLRRFRKVISDFLNS